MKKMMIIAVLISGMLMPAQIFAKENRGDKKPKAEYNKFEKNNKGNKKPQMNYKDFDKGNKKGNNYYAKKKPYKPYKPYKPNKPNVIVVNKPAPVPPPPPVKVVYKSNPISAAASLVGLAALIAVIAD